jgi:hypothetical protein
LRRSGFWDDGSSESGYWSDGQIYHVAYGDLDNYPLQIYYSGQASGWENVAVAEQNGTYGTMYFPGVTTQWNPAYSDCGFTPHGSYDAMISALASNPATSNQTSLDYISDVYCRTS